MEKWYKCPLCGADLLYGTNPCPSCKCSFVWTQQGPKLNILRQQQVIQPEISSPQSITTPKGNWDGRLPPHIAKAEQVWWQTFPRIKAELPPKLLQVFGGAKESPPREIVGKVILIAEIRAELRARLGSKGGSLLNTWNCYCNTMMDGLEFSYMAGTMTHPFLTFNVSGAVLSLLIVRFYLNIGKDPNSRDALQKTEKMQMGMLKEMGSESQLQELIIKVASYEHGHWENGLDTAFRAALWVCSNSEEALEAIWHIHRS